MLIAMCLKCALMIGLANSAVQKPPLFPRGPNDPLPTPREVHLTVESRMLKGVREMQDAARQLRENYERRPGDHREFIAQLKREEADFQKIIDRLEQKLKNPPPEVAPLMPIIPPGGPKPPRKD